MTRAITKHEEETRRKFNEKFDESPSIHHLFNFNISKKYIRDNKILDVGCWSGQFASLALKSTKQVYGIDPGMGAILYAKKKYPEAKFKIGTAQSMPYKNKQFDVVTYLEVIEHIPQNLELKSLKEIARVLKPRGHLILSTPHSHLVSILFDPAYFLIGHRHYSQKYITKLLSESGFTVKRVYITGGMFRLLSLIFDSIKKHILKTQFQYPIWFENIIEREYYKGGFAQLHIVAQKK